VLGASTCVVSELNAARFLSNCRICPEIYSVSNCGGSPWVVSYWEINDFFFLKKGEVVRRYWIACLHSDDRLWQL